MDHLRRHQVGKLIERSTKLWNAGTYDFADLEIEVKRRYPEYKRLNKRYFTGLFADACAAMPKLDENGVTSEEDDADAATMNTDEPSIFEDASLSLNAQLRKRYQLQNNPGGTGHLPSDTNASPNVKKTAKSDTPIVRKKPKLDDPHASKPAVRATAPIGREVEHTVTLDALAGIERIRPRLARFVAQLRAGERFQRYGLSPASGLLVHGPSGCGKTLLANAIVASLGCPALYVVATELFAGVTGLGEQRVRQLFKRARELRSGGKESEDDASIVLLDSEGGGDTGEASALSAVIMDDLDLICGRGNSDSSSNDLERRLTAQLCSCLDELGQNERGRVLLIGITSRPESIPSSLRRPGRLDKEVCLGVPTETDREALLSSLIGDKIPLANDVDAKTLAHLTPGYVAVDLKAMLQEAVTIHIERDDTGALEIGLEDFRQAIDSMQPSMKREGFSSIPNVTWNDVGGLRSVRDELHYSIVAPVRHRQLFERLGLSAPAGVLLHGPPGCGKTLLAKALANESGFNFICVSGPELLSMYVGESERAIRAVFRRARDAAPCVLFFDEFDALAPRRTSSGSGGDFAARLVNQLLTEMDGIHSLEGVYILAATNRPHLIDTAVLRPGRIDKKINIQLPNVDDRVDILEALTKHGTKPPVLNGSDTLRLVAEKTDGCTGAHLAAVVREAAAIAFRRFLSRGDWKNDKDNEDERIEVSIDEFLCSIEKYQKQVSTE